MQIAARYGEIHWERTEISLSDEIISLCKQIETDYKNPKLRLQIAQAYARQQLFREAVESISIALSFAAFQPNLYRARGDYLMRLARFDEAASDFSMALMLEPTNANAGLMLGISSYFMARFHTGEAAIRKALSLFPPEDAKLTLSASVWMWRLLMSQGKNAEALKQIEQAVQNESPEQDADTVLCKLYAGKLTPEAVIISANSMSCTAHVIEINAGLAVFCTLIGQAGIAGEICTSMKEIIDDVSVWHTLGAHLLRSELKKYGSNMNPNSGIQP